MSCHVSLFEIVCSTSFTSCRKNSELGVTMLAEGGVGGTRSRIPTVARKQATVAGIAYIKSYKSDDGTKRDVHHTRNKILFLPKFCLKQSYQHEKSIGVTKYHWREDIR